ncbi:MAG: cysteine dioxygenase family protein [Planctomycetota bacterium]
MPLDELTALQRELEVGLDDVRGAVRFSDEGYRRNLLRPGPGYHALILCWKAGQKSPIHDHRGSACGIRVLQGEVTETKFSRAPSGRLVEGETGRLAEGCVCGSYDADIHEIVNLHPDGTDLVTLHIYSPPLLQMGLYSRDTAEVDVWTAPVATAAP